MSHAYKHAVAVTPNNSANLANWTQAVYVGASGSLKVDMINDGVTVQTVTFAAVPAGTLLTIRVSKIYADGTANSIIALN